MANAALIRTDYWNRVTNTVRSGNPSRTENVTDIENFAIPYTCALTASLHLWGIATGLTATAVADQPGLTIAPGAATDKNGYLIALVAGGIAITDPDIDPTRTTDIPTTPVSSAGITLSTTDITGTRYLTIRYHEVTTEGLLGNAPTLTHAPWIRLQSTTGFDDDGTDLVLAHVTLANGKVSALTAQLRHHTGIHADRIQFHKPHAATTPTLSVAHIPTAELATQPNGSLTLTQTGPEPTFTIDTGGNLGLGTATPTAGLHIDRDATDNLALKLDSAGPGWGSGLQLRNTSAGARTFGLYSGSDAKLHIVDVDSSVDRLVIDKTGNVGIGTRQPGRPLHVEGTEIHSGGNGAGFSFADRTITTLVNNPGATGQRWVWYAHSGSARLWSGGDRVVVDKTGNVGIGIAAGQARRPLHVEGSEIHSGGSGGGLSFADRATGTLVENPGAGQRWVWYAHNGSARLWSGSDRLSINVHPNEVGLDVNRRMRIRAEGGPGVSAGTWLFQNGQDRGFVGLIGDDEVGLYGSGFGWGLRMNTNTGTVRCLGGNGAFQSALSCSGNIGVWATGTASGIIATAPIAGQFFGEVRITGALSKGGGGFKIDHPLDPENKYLSHSFVESPEMLNLYRGTATTDEHGNAQVHLPDYFETLNEEFGYQLTPLGEPVTAAIATEIKDNSFTIRSDKPFARISWQVTGVRKDPWANAHRIEVEEAKPEHEQHYFLHPTEHGAAATRGLHNLEN
ncbi:hypothetical protein [Nocardia sp. XZ_19_385]|uniref:hypothetical protein n=1 Tax=Nocardia sp. XZ_19_385 TaxID=2769488 RepID=UPI00188FB278|nr:hypothetical protein [Nocardia sp. XZ_19_385]